MIRFLDTAKAYYPNAVGSNGSTPTPFSNWQNQLQQWWGQYNPGGKALDIVSGAGRFGDPAFFFEPGIVGGTVYTRYFFDGLYGVGTQPPTVTIGFPILFVAGSQAPVVRLLDGITSQVDFRLDNNGFGQFTRNGTNLGSNTNIGLSVASFHYLELQFTVHGSAGVCICKVDGVTKINLTAQNTSNSGNNWCTGFDWGTMASAGPGFYANDIYVTDTSNADGLGQTGFLGDITIPILDPTGNGTYQDFTPASVGWQASQVVWIGYQIVDSNGRIQQVTAVTGDQKTGGSTPTWATVIGNTTTDNHATWTCKSNTSPANWMYVGSPYPPGDGTYLQSNTVNQKSTFTFPAISGSTAFAVMLRAQQRKDDAGQRSMRFYTKSGASEADSGADIGLASSYQENYALISKDPATNAQWTVPGVNGAEFGFKLTV